MVKGAIDHPLYIVVSGDMAVAVNLADADDGINYKWIAAIPGKSYLSAPSSSIISVPSGIDATPYSITKSKGDSQSSGPAMLPRANNSSSTHIRIEFALSP